MRRTKVSRHVRKTKKGKVIVRKHSRNLKNRDATYIRHLIFAEHGSPLEEYLKAGKFRFLIEAERGIRSKEHRQLYAKVGHEMLSEPYVLQKDFKLSTKKEDDIADELIPVTSTASKFRLEPAPKGAPLGKIKLIPTDVKPAVLYGPRTGFKLGESSILSMEEIDKQALSPSERQGKRGVFMRFKPIKDILVDELPGGVYGGEKVKVPERPKLSATSKGKERARA